MSVLLKIGLLNIKKVLLIGSVGVSLTTGAAILKKSFSGDVDGYTGVFSKKKTKKIQDLINADDKETAGVERNYIKLSEYQHFFLDTGGGITLIQI